MHDGPNVLGRLRDFYDGIGSGRDFDECEAVEPRRALIPDYEVYEPPSRWAEDVQFVAFIVMLCLAVLLVLTVLVSVIADGLADVPRFSNIQIILGVGTGLSFMLALLDKLIP
jgi:hypothetical protein